MKFGFAINPYSGNLTIDNKYNVIKKASKLLDGESIIAGLDTKSKIEFRDCIKDLENKVDVIIGCGGDGTIYDIINSIKEQTTISYLPLGTGNALKYTLPLPNSITKNLKQIKNGKVHLVDLILCNNDKKALLASIGVDGQILKLRKKYLIPKGGSNIKGFIPYIRATIDAIFKEYERCNIKIDVDGNIIEIENALSLIITKIPFYGFGLNIMPEAVLDDGNLHLRYINSGTLNVCYGILTSFLNKNKIGKYIKAKKISILSDKKLILQIHGDIEKEDNNFDFEILPNKLRMIY
ncbi:MAG: NAD(+)/NADH kinase [Candidatus Firestonebacteria bacterium]|nr:NAD(+)/NADH kinase [Candidatus Firestonebacteria bacterium]